MRRRSAKRLSIVSGLNRREVLGFIGGTAAVSLMGCVRGQAVSSESTNSANSSAGSATLPNCVVKPEQTEGPYFVDEKLNRSDIRSDPSDGSVKAGVPLQLVFQVSQVSRDTCTPLSDAVVDIWHCDAEGIYSDVNERRFNTVGKKFLRGYQVTDADGTAQFVTIYPGWYPGRAVHIHFKIRTNSASQSAREFTSQLYFDDAVTDQIYRQSPYSAERQRTPNNQDGIFQNGGNQLMLQLTQAAEGYVGRFSIGLE
ncbi:intradiol ring-cleavage dioxygenase [Pseudanabaena sp. FACHB-2040]|nr:intradiol ring-cleavage dioxygenase [Pseudanabaena sp. FACHB-2040]MBD2257393.1 intradiol ring-cleavage dioxygenase [Pseudanabaena sp. FACHB-2040]